MNLADLKKEVYSLVRSNEALFEFTQNHALEGLLCFDIESGSTWINPKLASHFRSSTYTENISSIVCEEDLEKLLKNIASSSNAGTQEEEIVLKIKSESGLSVRCKLFLSKQEESASALAIIGCSELYEDTPTPAIRKGLREIAQIGTWEYDISNHVIRLDATSSSILQVSEGSNLSLKDFLYLLDAETYDDGHISEFLNGNVNKLIDFEHEYQIKTKDGKGKWIKLISLPYTEDQKVKIVHGLIQDVDDRNKELYALALKEEEFRQTFYFAANGMALVGLEGQWLDVNKSVCDMLGYTKEEFLKITFQDITHPEDLEKDLELLNELVNGERQSYQMEKRYFHKNGNVVWGLLSVSMVKNDNGEPIHFVSQINNITQRKHAQIELEQTITRLQAIRDATTQVSIIETDTEGIIQSFNKGAENLLGYESDEVVQKHTPEIIHDANEVEKRQIELSDELGASLTPMETLIAYARMGRFETREWTYIRKNGTRFPVLLSVTSIKDKQGNITGFLGVAVDMTKIKEVEKEIKSILNITQEQNERLLNFAHIVSHNLRSHSSNIFMILQLITMEVPESTENEFFPFLESAAKNLNETIGHLTEVVTMNETTQENLVPLSPKEFIDKAINNSKGQILDTHAQVTNLVGEKPEIQGIPAYLDSIFFNFINNAIKYRSPDRTPEVKVSSEVKNDFLSIYISDNGLGINLAKHGEKLFGMYKTFHGNEDARGVGLFITKNQIEAMGGTVEVSSEVNQGTTFHIRFRLA
ncbi:MAG: diguanylate cyclase [Roseivirga sp. XM-24bin3]|nr:MAG: diguanylate cyclase [Roseivirga sp. XM-24bin3]